MLSSLVHRVTIVPPMVTHISCNGIGSRCCMENFLEKKKDNLKLCSTKMKSRVSVREQVSPLFNVDSKEVAELNGKLQEQLREREMVLSSDGIGIVKFIKGKVFLITGATGFLAKVLIEKILRTVPDVGKIYLVIKAKDKDAALQRIQTEIINTELFKRLRQTHGKSHQKFLLSKLVPVVGNLCESNLGMEMEIADKVANEVDIIINSGCNTTFDERFDVSLNTNTLGPCRFLSFAKRCRKLKLFLHVSTAYVNGERQGIVLEKPFYKGDSIAREKAASENPMRPFPRLDVEGEVKMALDASKAFQDNIVAKKMKEYGWQRARSYGWQDTYVFTKAMGEMIIDSQREEIPVVIIRPSVIESTYSDPIPGWIEGIRMLDPLLVSYAKGQLTGFPMDGRGIIDTVPADMVVNGILAAAVKHAKMRKPAGLSIYQIASSVVNPLVYQDLFSYFYEYFNSSPYMDMERRPINIQRMKLFSSMDDFHSHIRTEAVQRSADATQGAILSKKLQKSLDIAQHLAQIYEPYMFYGGRFDNSNTQRLLEEMSHEEQRCFGFDVSNIDWKDYICNIHIPGVMTHALKGRGM
ncbi:Fatty acyl-coa reductase [Thalictrum thalictroides]|uniref:Fatty acyl-CoA reductase n=1 Tax=Thalictrum thalictroides TaxID=46969 RepID=A0A7J6VSH6_THATH|nr:Fatty acyl-coa reductase [Thalictrum thalictroides]